MHSKETDDGEVSEVSVEGLGSVLSGDLTGEEKAETGGRVSKEGSGGRREEKRGKNERNLLGRSSISLGNELLVDLTLLDERVEDVQDRVARPDLDVRERESKAGRSASLSSEVSRNRITIPKLTWLPSLNRPSSSSLFPLVSPLH